MFTPERILAVMSKYERPFMFISTACGFTFDLFIARRPDSLFVNTLLLTYLCVSAFIIIRLQAPARRAGEKHITQTLAFLLTLTFCFGGLAGNLLILYGKSGTPAGNILFLLLLLGLFVGNEFVRNRYEQFRFNIGAWYLLLLTYCIIATPTFLLHAIGAKYFLISGGISLTISAVFLLTIGWVTRLFNGQHGLQTLFHSILIIIGIFSFFNVLYFTGIIPPVPLALKQIGVYHTITHTGNNYIGTYEHAPVWEFWRSADTTIRITKNEPLYCFSAVFAPTDLATPIAHRFEYYDTTTKTWITATVTTFPISGGREDGYRGYSIVTYPQAGKWRCDVETDAGDLIGRTSFTVAQSTTSPILSQKTL